MNSTLAQNLTNDVSQGSETSKASSGKTQCTTHVPEQAHFDFLAGTSYRANDRQVGGYSSEIPMDNQFNPNSCTQMLAKTP